MKSISSSAIKYNYAHIVLPAGNTWNPEEFPFEKGIHFYVGGSHSHGYGNRVLTLKTAGSLIEDGINHAIEVAMKNNVEYKVVRTEDDWKTAYPEFDGVSKLRKFLSK